MIDQIDVQIERESPHISRKTIETDRIERAEREGARARTANMNYGTGSASNVLSLLATSLTSHGHTRSICVPNVNVNQNPYLGDTHDTNRRFGQHEKVDRKTGFPAFSARRAKQHTELLQGATSGGNRRQ